MEEKAYIVANKEQELDVLKKLENDGFKWGVIGTLPTKFRFSEAVLFNVFPYVINTHEDAKFVGWSYCSDYHEGNVVYDGRKEEKMYKVTQEFINELIKWRDNSNLDAQTSRPDTFVDGLGISEFPEVVEDWWVDLDDPIENNNRLIAIIQWLNGEDVFEVEEPHKFVVRSKYGDDTGDYTYVLSDDNVTKFTYILDEAKKFETREEAQEWANSHQVVVEIDEEGNEVEE